MNMSARRIGAVILGAAASVLIAALATASPAAADNGPHISVGSAAVIGAGPDGCADCHRLHSAQGATVGDGMLFKNNGTGAEFCETCHGVDAVGSYENVVEGKSTMGTDATDSALRGGGFEHTLMDTSNATAGPTYWNTSRSAWSTSKWGDPLLGTGKSSIPVTLTAQTTTSSHSLEVASTVWGSGLATTGATSVTLECTSCHNPHGNGNYRILRPVGSLTYGASEDAKHKGGTVVGQFTPVLAGTATLDTEVTVSTKYKVVFTATSVPFRPGMLINVWTSGGTPTKAIERGLVSEVDTTTTPNTFTVRGLSAVPTGWTAGTEKDLTGYYAAPNSGSNFTKAVANGTTIVYTVAAYGTSGVNHGLWVGQKVTIKTAGSGFTAWDQERAEITAATATTITVSSSLAAATVGIEAGLYLVGIPDGLAADAATLGNGVPVGTTGYKKVYTTDDYFQSDDHYYTGEYKSVTAWTDQAGTNNPYAGLKSGFIVNVSEWCATCHTRYLANSGARSYASKVDGAVDTFKYRHTSMSKQEGSQGCMACHVAHGTSAAMSGTYSSGLKDPDGNTPSARALDANGIETANGTSRLLRANNRGVCLLCHKAAVTTG